MMELSTGKASGGDVYNPEADQTFMIVNFDKSYYNSELEKNYVSLADLENSDLKSRVSQEDFHIVSKWVAPEKKTNARSPREGSLSGLESLVRFLSAAENTPQLVVALVAIKNFLTDNPPNNSFVQSLEDTPQEDSAFSILERILKRGNLDFTETVAFSILTALLVENKEIHSSHDFTTLLQWTLKALSVGSPKHLDFIVQHVQNLLSFQPLRKPFYDTPGMMEKLKDILQASESSVQMHYQIIYCLWLLTFENPIAETLLSKVNIAGTLVEITKSTIKEKVVRIAVLVFVNLFTLAFESNIAHAIGNKLSNLVESLSLRQWADSDIEANLKLLSAELDKGTSFLSTWDEYLCEVTSGKLDFSPSHFSEHFWKDNAQRLDDNDYELLVKLTYILQNSPSPESLAIAVSDLGNYAKYNPPGIMKLDELGVKKVIMGLIEHENSQVRYQAIVASQKLILMT